MTKQAAINPAFVYERKGKRMAYYGGLLDAAHDNDTLSITTELIQIGTVANDRVFIVKAFVTTPKGTFSGYGDADPSNVSREMLPNLLRLAETRAKARALRDAINAAGVLLEGDADDDGPEYQPEQRAAASRPESPAFAEPAKPIIRAEPSLAPAPGPPRAGPPSFPPAKATEQQIRAILNSGNARGMSVRDLDTDALFKYGSVVGELSVADAAAYIKHLQAKEVAR